MRLTIAVKIAVAAAAVAILSIGAMAWISSENLKRGFIAYLSELERQDLTRLAQLLAEDYKAHGDFSRFQGQRGAMRDLLDQLRDAERRPPPPPRQERARRWDERHPPPPPDAPPEQRPPLDPMGFGPRLSLMAADGSVLIGPPDSASRPDGSRQDIMDGARLVGSLRLAPLRNISNASGLDFVRIQIRQTIWLALALTALAVLAALGLARHLLRPLRSLHSVTRRIAKGQFQARAEVFGNDELGELAANINGMARSLQRSDGRCWPTFRTHCARR